MKRKRFSEEQIIGVLQDVWAVITEFCRRHGGGTATFHAWKAKFGGMEVLDAKRLRALEDEGVKLKWLLADAVLDDAGSKDVLAKDGGVRRQARSGRASPGDDAELKGCLRGLPEQGRRLGCRRLHVLLRRDGSVVNRKGAQRLHRGTGPTGRRRLLAQAGSNGRPDLSGSDGR